MLVKTFRPPFLAVLAAMLAAGPSFAQQDASDPRPAFIARLKAVADAGALLDPPAVAGMLDIELHGETSSIDDACYQSSQTSKVTTTRVTAGSDTWYRVLPSGAGNLEIPAFLINRASTTGDAELGYTIVERSACPRDVSQKARIDASLNFGGLPSYACFSPDDVKRLLPAAKMSMATEGIFHLTYDGKRGNATGTQLDFGFRPLVPCATNASIMQSSALGSDAGRNRNR
jgi:hypothetical protein